MKISFTGLTENQLKGVKELSAILNLELSDDGIELKVSQFEKGLLVSSDRNGGKIEYSKPCEFYRALGLFVEKRKTGKNFTKREEAHFDNLGNHCDNSRNAVMTVNTVKKMIRLMALMGYNQLFLYTEDTYEIKEYPYFGYMRGRFTAQEIHECDEYAHLFGIELVPCVQMLAHLNAAFRWDCFREINDTDDILLIGDERTYKFLDTAIGTLAKMFTSRNINIGMDEAHMVGLGKYLDEHGYRGRFELMMEHLTKVIEICKKYGFKPTMWSDMFFKLLHNDMSEDGKIDEKIIEKVPQGVALAYWDYYSTDKKRYDINFERHQQFHNEIVFVGGAWRWCGMAPYNHFSNITSRLALESCTRHNIKTVMVTGWGDNGAECSIFATLPTIQLYAEFCYGEDTSDKALAPRFKTCTGGNYDDFMALDLVNIFSEKDNINFPADPSRYLFYQDILCGLFEKHVKIGEFNPIFKENAGAMIKAKIRNPQWGYVFDTNIRLNEVLAEKCDMGLRIKKAYDEKNTEVLRELADVELKKLVPLVEKLHRAMRAQWYSENKTFGFDVIDIRFGALKERIKAAAERIDEYLDGKADTLPELDEERLDYTETTIGSHRLLSVNAWTQLVSPNVI